MNRLGVGLMISYFTARRLTPEAWQRAAGKYGAPLFIDSGAYSAWSGAGGKGRQVLKVDEYRDFLRDWAQLAGDYANLDVIGDADATRRNQEFLEDAGLRPVPVYHTGEPWSELERLCSGYDRIALGGMNQLKRRRNDLRAWLHKCFSIAAGKSLHGFAVTAPGLMRELPWGSVDSSTWTAPQRWRNFLEPNTLAQVNQPQRSYIARYAAMYRSMGLEPAEWHSKSTMAQAWAALQIVTMARVQLAINARRPGFVIYLAGAETIVTGAQADAASRASEFLEATRLIPSPRAPLNPEVPC